MRPWYSLLNQQYFFSVPHIRLIHLPEHTFCPSSTNKHVPSIEITRRSNHSAWLDLSIWAEARRKYFQVWMKCCVVFRAVWHFAVGNKMTNNQVMNSWKRWIQGRERSRSRVFGSIVYKGQRYFKTKAAKTKHLRRRKTCHNKQTTFRLT